MPHRRGSFREDWNDLLARFANRGMRAALEDRIEESQSRKKRPARRSSHDVHRELLERSQR